ncbi:hypothetical protein T4C_2965 [Trichinella pseudospiralis]|uniref:Uncharacterized protein n=1 Tax=Trichinella pseudospiralis TaxID=6337 RepID=A0A0V1GAG0_TRIPS|nr:hypothetical protein T4C_2965 [Trichinella pseudospiralis]
MHKKLNLTKIQVFTYVDRCSDENKQNMTLRSAF